MNTGSALDPIHDAVFGLGDDAVRRRFALHFGSEIAEFERLMAVVYGRWQELERRFVKDRDSATVVGTLFVVVARLLLSMKLLMLGHIALAGAAKRQVLEALAQAFLFSKHGWPYLEQAWTGRFSVNKAIDLVLKRSAELDLDYEALRVVSQARDFYHKFSHSTVLAMSDVIDLDGSRNRLGATFDEAKLEFYRREVTARVSLARTLL
jgi:hypothetical protein